MPRASSPRRVVIVTHPGLQSLDVVGPAEVFAAASDLARRDGDAGYRITVASPAGGAVEATSGLQLLTTPLRRVRGAVDTLVVAGGEGTRNAVLDRSLVRAVESLAARARRVASVCSGAFVLAAAGLLDGKRATTHWSVCGLLAELHPAVEVDPDPIYVRDGDVWTSAGVTAGMDLALALVEDDLGRDLALAVARQLVLFLKRPGGQSQFSAQLGTQLAERDVLRDLQAWIVDHPGEDLSAARLADRAGMSPRHLARCFQEEAGTTPARYVERVRVEAARRRLEDGDDGVEAVAAACGFGTAETMRRTFLRVLGATPTDYRRRFRVAPSKE